MSSRKAPAIADVDRLLRRYLANGVRLELDPASTRLSLSHPGMGTVVVEADGDGLTIREPVDYRAADPEAGGES
jgi:hypothetical protein